MMPFSPPLTFDSPLRYGSLELASRYLLSPLAGYTNLPFRRVIRPLSGLGLATTDLVNARGLVEGGRLSHQLIQTTDDDTPLAVQIFGHDPQVMAEAARILEARGVDSIDINMGCPVDHVTKTGAGASLMQDTDRTVGMVASVVESVSLPVTVKMRLGWDEHHITAPRFARLFEDVGVVAIAIHGRTRSQGFSGHVDRSGIRQVVEAVESIPVIGNGDIRTIPDAIRMFQETGCAGISIGRGALANPWIFRQLVEWETGEGHYQPAGGFDDRLSLLRQQFLHLEQQLGFEIAIGQFRRMAHWYLKSMHVRSALRHRFDQAKTREELEVAIREINEVGPHTGSRDALPDMHVPVPSGPVERW